MKGLGLKPASEPTAGTLTSVPWRTTQSRVGLTCLVMTQVAFLAALMQGALEPRASRLRPPVLFNRFLCISNPPRSPPAPPRTPHTRQKAPQFSQLLRTYPWADLGLFSSHRLRCIHQPNLHREKPQSWAVATLPCTSLPAPPWPRQATSCFPQPPGPSLHTAGGLCKVTEHVPPLRRPVQGSGHTQ